MPRLDAKQIRNLGIVDVKNAGVTYGSGVSSTVRTANTTALSTLLNSELNIFVSGIVEVNGTITVTNKNIHLHGIGLYGIIRQTTDANLLVINQTNKSTTTNIYDICFEAGGTFTTGVAITHNGYGTQDSPDTIYQKPFADIHHITIKGQNNYVGASNTWTHEWKKGIVFSVPNRISFRDSTIQGASGTNNTTGTIGIELTTTRAAVESVFDNVQVVNTQTGLKYTQATVSPAIEGLHINNCSFISNWRSVDLLGSSAYVAPGWYIIGCHFASLEVCLNINNIGQGFIDNCLFYNYGNSTSGQTAAMIQMNTASDWNISNNKMYYQGGGTPTNKAYGILCAGSGSISAVANLINNNYISLYTNDTKPAIWLQDYAVNNKVYNNYRNGGNSTVTANSPFNTIINNTPADTIDGGVLSVTSGTNPGATLTRVNAGNPAFGYILDVTALRGNFVTIPDSTIESTSFLKSVTMNYGQEVTIFFAGQVAVLHSSEIYLEENVSDYFGAGDRLVLYKSYSGVFEKTRVPNFTRYNFLSGSTSLTPTIDPSRGEVYSLHNTTGSLMTVTITTSKFKVGQKISLKRYSDTSTSAITITTSSGSIQKPDGGFVSSWALPVDEGSRQYTWIWTTGGNLEMVAGSAITNGDIVVDTTALAAYVGPATMLGTKDGRWWTYSAGSSATANAGTIVTATGKGAGRWLLTAPLNGLNVKWFGATGDGTTDDTTACQAALDAASTSTTLGNRVYFPEGTYLVYSLSVPADISVDLMPNSIIKGRVLTTPENNAQTSDQTIVGIVELAGGASISGGGIIDGNKANRQKGHGVKIYSVSNSKSSQVINIQIKNTKNCGIFCQSGFKPLFQNNKIDACDDRGIDVVETSFSRVIGNAIDSCAHGIQWYAGGSNWIDNVTITGNVVTNVSGGGIWGYRGRSIDVTGNTCNNCDDVGIDFEECEDCIAAGNTIRDCYNGGLTTFYACKRITFIGNSVNQGTGNAACVVFNGTGASNEIKIQGGTLYSNGSNSVTGSGGCITCIGDGTNQILTNVFIDNVHMECTQSGFSPVRLTDVNGGAITNCKNIKGNAATCISLEGCASFDVTGNTLMYSGTTNASAKGIQLISRANFANQYNTVRNNTIDAGYQMGIYDDPWTGVACYNKIIDNITPAVTFGAVVTPIAGYNATIERNRSLLNSLVDNSAIYTSLGNYFASTTYVQIGQVLDNSSSSNSAQLAFKLYHVRGWDSTLQCVDEYVIANKAATSFSQNIIQKRTGFDTYTLRAATIVVYQTTISSTTVNNIYVKIAAGFNQVGLSIDYLGYGNKLSSYVSSTTTPTGTVVYDSGDPITYPPLQLNSTVMAITTTSDTGNTTRYFPIAVLPASGGGTYDSLELDIEIGSWDASAKQQISLYVGNKTAFSYRWTSMGSPQSGAYIVAYQNSGVTTIYACMDKSFRVCSYRVRNNVQCTVYDALAPIAGTPSGSVVFNSSDPGNYPYTPILGVTAPYILQTATNITTYTITSGHHGMHIDFVNSAACTVTIQAPIPKSFTCSWAQSGAGQLSFVGGTSPATVTLRLIGGNQNKSGANNAVGSMIARGDNDITMGGYLVA